jgi:hypothetical protein
MQKALPKQSMLAIQQRQFASNALMMNSVMHQKSYYQQNYSYFTPMILPMLGLAYFLSGTKDEAAWCHPHVHDDLHALSAMQAVKGNEDNKIRFFGSPQEITEPLYNQRNEENGQTEMSYKEFLHALTSFNYTSPKDNSAYFRRFQKQINSVLHLTDADRNGQIGFTEFYFFVLLLQTHKKTIKQDFKKFGGKMNAKQFSTNLTAHRRKNHFVKKQSRLAEKDEDFLETNKAMTATIFKNKKDLNEEEFFELKNSIQEVLWHYEFFQLNVDE